MNLAVIENGLVVNVIITGVEAPDWAADYPLLIPPASIGWRYIDGQFLPPIITPLTPQELRERMPDKTPREFRNALVDIGIDPKVVTAKIEEIPFDTERMKALNAWEVMTSASRIDPYIDMIGSMFDKTPEQIDAAWVATSG